MPEELFRKEALDARRDLWFGRVSVVQPRWTGLLTLLSIIVVALIVSFLTFAKYTRRSTVAGQLAPSAGVIAVLAPSSGVITRLNFREGLEVFPGTPLAIVTAPRATINGGSASAAIAENIKNRRDGLNVGFHAQSTARSLERIGLRKQLAQLREEYGGLLAEIATREGQVSLAKETLDRLKQLEDARYVSVLQIVQQKSALLEHVATVQALQRQMATVRRTIVQLEQSIEKLPSDQLVGESRLKSDLAALEQEEVENDARGALRVVSPAAGVVANQLVKIGQSVEVGQPILNILPSDSVLEADLLVPSRAIGFISVGDSVHLRYRAFPYQKFGHQLGKVKQVGRSALGPGDLGELIAVAGSSEPFYKVTVSLVEQQVTAYGKREELKAGMVLEADILGDQRSLIEWVFEPLYALKGRAGSDN
ncbi:HlyD family secretion protein [Stenotrophomonas cyclobalanopsidis]|uniref:HlyD family secretion protein n=1 Tax=Stenotrophomonas cyclobalanopsidis TaxID=2771362 RepID=UPI003460699A